MIKKILNFIKKDLRINEINKFFKKNKEENYNKLLNTTQKLIDTTKLEIKEIDNLSIELKKELLKNALQKYEKLNYSKNYKYYFLLADDNPNSTKLMLNDLNYIFKKPSLITNEIFNKKVIQERDKLYEKIKNLNFGIITAQGETAPYSIIKSLDNLKIDYAILDIIFGGVLIYKNRTYIFDGIDIAEHILKHNSNAIILFYTGCNLSENSEEYNKIQKLSQTYNNQIFITDKDINDETRIKKVIESLEYFTEVNKIV